MSTWSHCLEHAAMSNVGLRRSNNQDSMAVALVENEESWQKRGHLFMVADGMGAHAAGELASKLATDIIPLAYSKLLGDRAPPEAIRAAVEDANNQIHSRGQASLDFKGMGTTCTVLLLLPQGALVAHVGDSRAYRLRGNRYEQLTFDHSLVWEMRAAGQIRDDEGPSFVPKNIITRSLGPNASVQVDLEGPFPVEVGDTFLLCSDGLSGPVNDEEMSAVLQSLPISEAVQALIDLANLRGGPDNITVNVARVVGPQGGRSAGALGFRAGNARPRPIHPLHWTLLGATVLATAVLAALGNLPVALGTLVVAVLLALAAVLRCLGGESEPAARDGRPLGRGPYRACACGPNAGLVEQLAAILDQLRDAAAAQSSGIDVSRFQAAQQRAAAAGKAGDYAGAVRESFRAIRWMLDELKSHRDANRQGAAGD